MSKEEKPISWDPETKIGRFMLEWFVPNDQDSLKEILKKKALAVSAILSIFIGGLIITDKVFKVINSPEEKTKTKERYYQPRKVETNKSIFQKEFSEEE